MSARLSSRQLLKQVAIVAVAAVFALPVIALADAYTVALRNGNVFRCRAQPQAAPWDANKLLFRTDVGNWIALKKADVLSVESDAENRGYGKVINSSTLMLGDAPNDAPSGDDADAGGNYDSDGGGQQQNYNINQFVEPGATQGLPGAWIGNSYGGSSSGSSSGSGGGSGGGGGGRPTPRPAARAAAAPPAG